jgi:hypothetical protein
LEQGETPVEWANEPRKLFTETTKATGIRMDRVDLDSERRETWYDFTPKGVEGAMLNVEQLSITPDGKWMVFNYVVQLGQFYVSENLR